VYLECWVEKDGLEPLVRKVAHQLDVATLSSHGFTSIDALKRAAERFRIKEQEGKMGIILYAGDFDPAGEYIPRKIQDGLNLYGSSAKVEVIALFPEQIEELNLPPFPAKDTPLLKHFTGKEKGLAWELDAMPAKTLQNLFTKKIQFFIHDIKMFNEAIDQQEKDRDWFYHIGA
jgi:hypothetical protein